MKLLSQERLHLESVMMNSNVTGEVKLRVFFQDAFVICFRQLLHGSCENY